MYPIAMIAWLKKLAALFIILPTCTCKMEGFIVGGSFVKIDRYPHAVYLYVTVNKEAWICGASIVNQRILLTAGHCLDGCVKQWSVKAYGGSENVNEMTFMRDTNKYIIHRGYEPRRTVNDIALAFLKTNLPLGRNVKRVVLSSNFPNVKDAEVAGWGLVNDQTGEDSEKLKAVSQDLQPGKVCRRIGELSRGMLCAMNSAKNRPSRGDSGSALMSRSGEQIGLVSFRYPNMPELIVYTNVSYYYIWIMDSSKMLFCRG